MGDLLLLKKPGVTLPLDPSVALKYPFALTGPEDHLPSFFSVLCNVLPSGSSCCWHQPNRQLARAATVVFRKASPRLVPELGLRADDVPL